jgi:hypothetical protein
VSNLLGKSASQKSSMRDFLLNGKISWKVKRVAVGAGGRGLHLVRMERDGRAVRGRKLRAEINVQVGDQCFCGLAHVTAAACNPQALTTCTCVPHYK